MYYTAVTPIKGDEVLLFETKPEENRNKALGLFYELCEKFGNDHKLEFFKVEANRCEVVKLPH